MGQLSKALSMDASQVKTMLTEMERLKLLWRQYRMIDRRVYEISRHSGIAHHGHYTH